MEGERNRAPSHSSTAQLCSINNLWEYISCVCGHVGSCCGGGEGPVRRDGG